MQRLFAWEWYKSWKESTLSPKYIQCFSFQIWKHAFIQTSRKVVHNIRYSLKWATWSGFVTTIVSWNYYTVYIFVPLDDRYTSLWRSLFNLVSRGRKWCSFSHWFLQEVICDAFFGQYFSLTLIMTFEIQGNVCCASAAGWRQAARLNSVGFGLELALFCECVWIEGLKAFLHLSLLPHSSAGFLLQRSREWGGSLWTNYTWCSKGHPVSIVHLKGQLMTTEDKFPGGKYHVNYKVLSGLMSW